MSRLLHLNGAPGIGKSTVARLHAARHPGTLACDIDVLRTMIGGWSDDFLGAGALVRPAALAMIGAYLAGGHDVVLPQLLLDPAQVALFEACAVDAGAVFVERVLQDPGGPEAVVARFARRGSGTPDPWHDQVRAIVADQGGDDELRRCHARLQDLLVLRPGARVVDSSEGRPEETCDELEASLVG